MDIQHPEFVPPLPDHVRVQPLEAGQVDHTRRWLRKLGRGLARLFETYGVVYPQTILPAAHNVLDESSSLLSDVPLGQSQTVEVCTIYNRSDPSFWQKKL